MDDEDTLLKDNLQIRTIKIAYVVSVISLSRFIYGYDRGAIGGSSIGLISDEIISADQYAVLVSLPIYASAVGCLAAGVLQSKLGRKFALFVSTVLYCLGLAIVVMIKKQSFQCLLLGRIISNFAFGMGNNTSLVYVIEITPSNYRGIVLVLNTLLIPLGNSLSGLANLAISKAQSSDSWRLMLELCFLPGLMQLLLIIPIPMSYVWLHSQGKAEKSRSEASKLYKNLSPPQYNDLLEITEETGGTSSNVEAKSPSNINHSTVSRMCTVAVMLILIGQLSGFTAVIYYSVEIAHTSGITDADDSSGAFAVSEAIFVANFFGVLISMGLVEKLGRRRLLLISQLGTFLSLLLIIGSVYMVDSADMGIDPFAEVVNPACAVRTCSSCVTQPDCGFCYFGSSPNKQGYCIDGNAQHSIMDRCEIAGGTFCASHCHTKGGIFLFVSMVFFTLFFSIGLAPIPMVVAAEIFPYHLRDVFTSVATSVFYVATASVTLAFGSLYLIIGMTYVYTMFAVSTFLGLIFVFKCVPETRDKSPENMYQLFQQPWCCGGDTSGYSEIYTRSPSDEEVSE